MHKPDAPLPILGRRADEDAISSFLAGVNVPVASYAIGSLRQLREIVAVHQDILLARGATLRQLSGARIVYQPAIPAPSTTPQVGGGYNTTIIELTREKGNWYLTGATSNRCVARSAEVARYILQTPAIEAIAAQALQGVSVDPKTSCIPSLGKALRPAPEYMQIHSEISRGEALPRECSVNALHNTASRNGAHC